MKLDLSEYNVYEKFGWLVDDYGAHEAISMTLLEFKDAGTVLEKMVGAFQETPGDIGTDDSVEWLLEGWSEFDIIEYLDDHERVEQHVDRLLVRNKLDEVDTDTYNAFCEERNSK